MLEGEHQRALTLPKAIPTPEARAPASAEDVLNVVQSCPEPTGRWVPAKREVEVEEDDEDEDCCCVCLETFTDDNPAKKTKCGHQYHLQCIMQWYQRNSTCPMCFRQVELECESSQQLMVEATRPFIRMSSRTDAESASSASAATGVNATARRLQHSTHSGARPSYRVAGLATGPPRRSYEGTQSQHDATASTPAGRRSSTSGLSALKANFRKIFRTRSSSQ
uniref:RING-type E3 ubiquitin transferase n=1 Tax=Chloropicon roscoffensis TaxID=1461544 RepID=A0A7S3CBV9_9CHLO|mmetsp:Transcript_4769/g.14497  ORF Transcript_4769/g.14497 Transcript_4769/m.14497 type:complete len:222 (+) Transcript_4769:211-876(+)